MYYLVYPNGSRLFREPVPEDFAYHCLLLAIDKDLGLKAVKAPVLMELYFFCRLPPRSGLTPFPCQPVTSFFPVPSFASARVALLACRAVNKVSFKTFLSSEKERFAFLKPRKQHFAQRKVVSVRILTPKTVMLRDVFFMFQRYFFVDFHKLSVF